jgi:hypothetical protein
MSRAVLFIMSCSADMTRLMTCVRPVRSRSPARLGT